MSKKIFFRMCGIGILGIMIIGSLYVIKNKVIVKSVVDKIETASVEPLVYKTVVCLDAGHGGDDVGAEYFGRYEADDNLKITLAIKQELESLGLEVILTRSTDIYLDNTTRADYANSNEADVFVSLHRNYYEGYENVTGVEAWINDQYLDNDIALATAILEEIEENINTTIRGVKGGTMDGDGNYTINRVAQMPSCILELGFITSSTDNRSFDSYLSTYAKAIAQGIYKFTLTQDI